MCWAGHCWRVGLCCALALTLASECSRDGVCPSLDSATSVCEVRTGFHQIRPSRFFEVAACATIIPSIVMVRGNFDSEAAKDPAGEFLEVAERNKERRVNWWLVEGDSHEIWTTLRLSEISGTAALVMYTSNDEIEGLSVFPMQKTEVDSDASFMDRLSDMARDLDPTYVPYYASSSIQDAMAGPWCTAADRDGKSSAAFEEASRREALGYGTDQDRVCLLGASLLVSRRQPPPRRIPSHLIDMYTLNGSVRVHYNDSFRFEHGASALCYTDSARNHHCRPRAYSEADVEELVAAVRGGGVGYYGATDRFLYQGVEMVMGFDGLDVLVVGSVEPWYEAVCIAYGARSCTTIDYNPVQYQHGKLRSVTVRDLEAMPREERPVFDAAISISSFEHDGLGRYGDPLRPDGDLRAMKAIQELLVEGGRMFLAVPVGSDLVRWNMHRVYGRRRLPLLCAGWTLLSAVGFDARLLDNTDPTFHHQPVFVLENVDPGQPLDVDAL